MTSENTDESMISERYLAGSLSKDEKETFEARLLWDPVLQEDFELAQRLREGVRDLQPQSGSGTTAPPGFVPRYAMAAALMLGIGVGGGFALSQLTARNAPLDSVSTAAVYRLETLRSALDLENLPLVNPGGDYLAVTLVTYLSSTGHKTFRAELALQEGDGNWVPVWRGEPVSDVREDVLGVTIRADSLKPGAYRLLVKGWTGNGEPDIASENYFRVPAP